MNVRVLVLKYRRALILAIHLALIALANLLAFQLRFDGEVPTWAWQAMLLMLPWLLAIRGLVFIPFRLYEGLWRYTGIWDLRNILAGVVTSAVVFYAVVQSPFGPPSYPRSIFIVDALLLVFLMGGLRLARRIAREFVRVERGKRVLIFGAGNAGELIVRDMKNNDFYDFEPVGFVDDDPSKTGQRIHGVQVLGTREDLPHIMTTVQPHEVLVAIPRSEPRTVNDIVRLLQPFKVPISTLPNLADLLDGKIAVTRIRSLSIEDLLPRAPFGLDRRPVEHLLTGRRVMVTGAGGSIGSELCRQILAMRPERLLLYERYENSLYAITNALADPAAIPIVGDITDRTRVDAVMTEHRPQVVFHAAAHKHVPLMELHPCEAGKNNVHGTRVVAETALAHRVERFVLISSDKAVNPRSVMGATKRVAELIVQTLRNGGHTEFVTVRFGNVLGSNGSVVPRFLEQIKAGGPVTVTHPEMKRYFMLIPEAVQLVLQAAAQANAGGVFILEMGEQIKVVDLARNLIRLSGRVPDEEIPITYVGARQGDKLFEELLGPGEIREPSAVENVFRVNPVALPEPDELWNQILQLERMAAADDQRGVLEQLRLIVPTFRREEPAAEARDARVDGEFATSSAAPDPDRTAAGASS